MTCRRALRAGLIVGLALSAGASGAARVPADLPARLTDQEFWRLTEDLSEPDGTFRSENLVSNEIVFARVLPELLRVAPPGGVYLGVGPEQNFTYIAAMRPKLAIILDIRRGNLHLQLMYKALFELAADRADLVSLLFTKPRPATLGRESTARELMEAFWETDTGDEAAFEKNLQAIKGILVSKHGFPLSADDLKGIEHVYRAFYSFGPRITWSTSTSGVPGNRAHYKDLMLQSDVATGQVLSYLASEEKFAFLKDLEARNLVVPVVGNFGGPKAVRAIGGYLRGVGAVVTAFYVSNVEQYLRQDGLLETFLCSNVASLPLDAGSVFIRPSSLVLGRGVQMGTVVLNGQVVSRPPFTVVQSRAGSPVSPILPEVKSCSGAGWPRPAPR